MNHIITKYGTYLSEINGETHGSVQVMSGITREHGHASSIKVLGDTVEVSDTLVQGLVERSLLISDHMLHEDLTGFQLREGLTHQTDQYIHQTMEESSWGIQDLLTISTETHVCVRESDVDSAQCRYSHVPMFPLNNKL